MALVQTNGFQNWAIQKLGDRISKDLNTEIKVDSVYIDAFDGVYLEGILIRDEAQDTLLYSERIQASTKLNLLHILTENALSIKDVRLENTKLYLARDSGEVKNNLKFLLNYFSRKDTTQKARRPFYLDAESLTLDGFHFKNKDAAKGETIDAYLPKGELQFKEIDLPNNLIHLEGLVLEGLDFKLTRYERIPIADSLLVDKNRSTAIPDSLQQPFTLIIDDIVIEDSHFRGDNNNKAPRELYEGSIDFDHLDVVDIQAKAKDFKYVDWTFGAEIETISLLERKSGFKLEQLEANTFITPRKTELYNLNLETPNSNLGDTLIFKYRGFPDFLDFNNRVIMDARFSDDSYISVKEIMAFSPNLERNAFFRKNREEVVQINGRIRGKVTRLRGDNLFLKLADGTSVKGVFRSRDINQIDKAFIDFELERLNTSMSTLRLLVPNFNPPANFDKLERLDFKGKFFGFLNSFSAEGLLKTNLGSADMDIQMDIQSGRERATYEGIINLVDFDLKQWTEDERLGKVTFRSKIFNGRGLTGKTIKAELEASVEALEFQNYRYENLDIKGIFDKRFFEGDFKIKDDNIAFNFDGTIDFNDSIPVFDFKAQIEKVALQQLNLSKQDYTIKGDVDFNFSGNNASNIQGEASIANLNLNTKGQDYFIDTISIKSTRYLNGIKRFLLDSELLEVSMDGVFELDELPQDFLYFVKRNYPEFAEKLKINPENPYNTNPKNYRFALQVFDSKNFTQLVDTRLDTLKNLRLKGFFNNIKDTISLDIEVAELGFANTRFRDVVILSESNQSDSQFDVGVFNTTIGSNVEIPITAFYGNINRDTIAFNINTSNFSTVLDNMNLNGKFFYEGDLMQVNFLPSDLVLYNEKWNILKDNYIRFGEKYIETQNFQLTSKGKLISLKSIDNKGIALNLSNISLALVNDLITDKRFRFDGGITASVQSEDVFNLKNLRALVTMDSLILNGDNYGKLNLTTQTSDLKTPLKAELRIDDGDKKLMANGKFIPTFMAQRSRDENYLDFDLEIQDYPLRMLEYLISPGISETTGKIVGNVRVFGQLPKAQTLGSLRVYDASVVIDYLQTRYFIENEIVRISSYQFDATGGKLKDKYGNIATVTGGITHDHFKNWGLSCSVQSDQFLLIDTKKKDNELFYGTGIGNALATFSGTFRQTNIDINAVTGAGSNMAIPVTYGQDGSEVDFIVFEQDSTALKDSLIAESPVIRGLNLDMNITMTPQAEVRLIFDEQSGDILKGRGNGDIQLRITREGNFNMYGNYIVESGEYLFTLPLISNFGVNKPFVVKRGGTINWDGDPFGAQLDIEASYQNLTTPIYPFITEYLADASDAQTQRAKNPTKVDLGMKLTGALLKPEIDFTLGFPSLNGELKNVVESKLRVVESDKNELNRQVALLILTGQFIPTSSALISTDYLDDVGINTLSEFISTQLSNYLTDLLSEVIPDIDININYRQYDASTISDITTAPQVGRDVEVSLRKGFLDNRLNINLSDNISTGQGATASQAYAGPEFVIEYLITADGRLRFRAFKENQQDFTANNQIRWGAGLSYSFEFNSFRKKKHKDANEFFKGLREDAIKILEQEVD